MSTLVKYQMYLIKDKVEAKASLNPLKYRGVDDFRGKTYHSFYDEKTGLFHWIHPDEVEPVKEDKL